MTKRQVEPFIQISSLILNSKAYIDMSYSARSMLVEILHFYNGRNNGYIYISKKVLLDRGFSKNTATKALKELRTHGFLYMTRRGGNILGGCSWFAVTWLPINKVTGQFLDGFVPNAYLKWKGADKKKGAKNGTQQDQKACLINKSKSSQLQESKCINTLEI